MKGRGGAFVLRMPSAADWWQSLRWVHGNREFLTNGLFDLAFTESFFDFQALWNLVAKHYAGIFEWVGEADEEYVSIRRQ